VNDLLELLRIRSVGGAANAGEMRRAVEWVCDYVERRGGDVERRSVHGVPLGVATLPASGGATGAPTVLCYGHVDVQPVDSGQAWESDPFEPLERDGWLIARGAADDKGPFYALLRAAGELAGEGRLPVNVRVLCDTEEETGGRTAVEYLRSDRGPADACVMFDSQMIAAGRPAVILATRGVASLHLRVRTAPGDLHSGLYGGVAPNAAHALIRMIAAVLPVEDQLPEPLCAGLTPPTAGELESWGEDAETRVRLWARPAVDVHGVKVGITDTELNVVPAVAEAILSVRVAPGQDVAVIGDTLAALLRAAAPSGAEVAIRWGSRTPPAGPLDPSSPAIASGLDALERGFGVRPELVRSGGSLPILAALEQRSIPTLISGIDLPEGNAHGPNERLCLANLDLGLAAARELFLAWGALAPAVAGNDGSAECAK